MFDGIEGYPRYPNMARTFGKKEVTDRILNYFDNINFYYPYPDYKIPSLILSDEAFSKGSFGELISNFHSPRKNNYFTEPLFDETLALLEIEQNAQLNFFANSFFNNCKQKFRFKNKLSSLREFFIQAIENLNIKLKLQSIHQQKGLLLIKNFLIKQLNEKIIRLS